MTLAGDVLAALGDRGWTIGTAESLTGGLVVASLIDVPGASAHVRGGVVAYATDLKHTTLGVDRALLQAVGPVHADVAQAMAEAARRVLGADVGVATTGVAGPDPQDGQPVGTVFTAVATPAGSTVAALRLHGTRDEIRAETVRLVLELCLRAIPEGDR
ncbi:CinA family protein [Microbacterium sp. CFBP9034]|uniref:CinA family protein n=1 Tax=Microbacterium sp. CFBP9034 TaxID=3096540 RepID=UPI002A6AB9EA|nr:CinA family protein [Microbacterium sp. CFBP9034]MDY0909244.1 CinA family protein [Microbacterium sp. CFBP9034]